METMRQLTTLLLFALAPVFAQTSDEKDAVAAVQKIFDAMAARDATMLRSTILPDARLFSVRADGAPAGSAMEDFVTRIASSKEDLLERFTNPPAVSIRGRMAVVWGEYEFLRAGKFTHCGIDSVTLFKTPEGWKIAALTYTVEPTGCKGH
jgi:hypothetical protein